MKVCRRKSIRQRFIDEVFGGDYKAYKAARISDYLKVQFEWECWIDALCKSGEITKQQYEQVVF